MTALDLVPYHTEFGTVLCSRCVRVNEAVCNLHVTCARSLPKLNQLLSDANQMTQKSTCDFLKQLFCLQTEVLMKLLLLTYP